MAQAGETMREYETIYVLTPELSDSDAKDFMLKMKDLITRQGGQSIKVDCWGRKKLSWDRGKHERGLYVHHLYLGGPALVKEYERTLAIDERVILRQSVVVNPSVDPASRPEQPDQLDAPIIKDRREGFRSVSDFDGFDDRGMNDMGYDDPMMD
jgi:small subunit ribosomal protein S6